MRRDNLWSLSGSKLAESTRFSFLYFCSFFFLFFFCFFVLYFFVHGQVTVQCNTKVVDRVIHGSTCTTCIHSFRLVVELKFFSPLSSRFGRHEYTSAWRGDLGFDEGPQVFGDESQSGVSGERKDRYFFNDNRIKKEKLCKNKEYRSQDTSLWNTESDGSWLRRVAVDADRLRQGKKYNLV